jgi:hypothetical protein
VSKFERGVASGLFGSVSSQIEYPTGYDEELSDSEQPTPPGEKSTGSVSYGSGNAEFGETGNVHNSAGWVHGHFQGSSSASVVRDTSMVVKSLLQQGSPVYLNPGVDLVPGKKYSDDEIRRYVEGARKQHTHSGTGQSIDVFVKKGTKVPVSLTKVGPTGSGYGGYGRGGIAGYIQGTDTWIGHLTPNSKSGLSEKKGEIKGTEGGDQKIKQGKENVVIGDSIAKGQMDATGKKGKAVVGASPDKVMGYINEMNQNGRIKGNTVELSSGLANNVKDIGNVQKQLESLKSMGAASVLLSGTAKSGNRKDQIQANNELAALAAKYPGFVKFGGGFTPGADNVHPADAAAYNKQLTAMQAIVQPAPQAQVVPAAAPSVPQVQTYPTYNQPQSSVTVMPIMMRSQGGGGQQKPMIIPGGGGGGGTVILPGPSEGELVNSLMKTILLTNLSAT